MKHTTLLVSALLITLFTSCGPGKNEAIKYDEHIMTLVNNLTLSQNRFMNQLDGHHMDSLKLTRQQFAEHSKASLKEISKVEPFAEKTEYRDAAVAYFKTLYSLADTEGKQMVEIMAKDSANITETDVVNIAQLSTTFDADYEKAFRSLELAQAAFAKEWKFGIGKK